MTLGSLVGSDVGVAQGSLEGVTVGVVIGSLEGVTVGVVIGTLEGVTVGVVLRSLARVRFDNIDLYFLELLLILSTLALASASASRIYSNPVSFLNLFLKVDIQFSRIIWFNIVVKDLT